MSGFPIQGDQGPHKKTACEERGAGRHTHPELEAGGRQSLAKRLQGLQSHQKLGGTGRALLQCLDTERPVPPGFWPAFWLLELGDGMFPQFCCWLCV